MQSINDIYYGSKSPKRKTIEKYFDKMGCWPWTYEEVLKSWDVPRDDLVKCYMMMIHRLTGSGASYKPSTHGYHNSILPWLKDCFDCYDVNTIVEGWKTTMYTSGASQIPGFPKLETYKNPTAKGQGNNFIIHYLYEWMNEFWWELNNSQTVWNGKRWTQAEIVTGKPGI